MYNWSSCCTLESCHGASVRYAGKQVEMKVVRDIEDGELHLASTNEGGLGSCSTLQFLIGVSDSNPGSGVRR